MAQEEGQERTEPATPKRLREARERGQVVRSRELNTTAVLLASAGALLLLGGGMVEGLRALLRHGLAFDRARIFDNAALGVALERGALEALVTAAPLLAVTVIASLLAPMALGGWSFSTRAFSFQWDRLDPIKGLGRVFAWRGLIELVKALAKFSLVAVAAIVVIWNLSGPMLGLGNEPLERALAHAAHLVGWSFLVLSLAMLVIAAADVPFQLWDYARQLRMTRQELKDEHKETEGRPEVRSRIRGLQRELARRRMMAEVPKADVIVTNPTHYAVALRYEEGRMAAPLVIAKGRDLIAMQIRQVGAASRVPQMSAPPLARALYHSTELNRPIPAGLYLAVAQVLAYVYQLRRARSEGGAAPLPPKDLPIPAELKRD